MIKYKSAEEIKIMQEGGLRLQKVVRELMPQIKVGMTTLQIDNEAEKLIRKMGGEPSFKRVPNYHWATCLPINDQIVHTPPSNRVIKNGDVLKVDIGMFYKGFHTDYADTFIIGKKDDKEVNKFLETGRITSDKAIKKAVRGNKIGEISQTIKREIEGNEFSIIKELTGHGVGRELHEEPFIPGFLDRPIDKTLKIKPGLVIAIEVIYAKGSGEMVYEKQGDWSIATADGSISACFEHTIAVTDTNTIILT